MDISFSSMTTEVTDIKENVTNRRDIGITRTLSGAMCGFSMRGIDQTCSLYFNSNHNRALNLTNYCLAESRQVVTEN